MMPPWAHHSDAPLFAAHYHKGGCCGPAQARSTSFGYYSPNPILLTRQNDAAFVLRGTGGGAPGPIVLNVQIRVQDVLASLQINSPYVTTSAIAMAKAKRDSS